MSVSSDHGVIYTVQMWHEIKNLYGLIIQKIGFLDMTYHWEVYDPGNLRNRNE